MGLMAGISPAILFLIVFLVIVASSSIKVLREYERGVIFRLGRLIGAKGPGIIFIIPGVDKLLRISLRTVALEIPPQDVITRDNISIRVNAVVYFRVVDPNKAVVEIENYLYATSQLAQTTLRSIIGQSQLDELLSERDKINIQLQDILDNQTEPWGLRSPWWRPNRWTSIKTCSGPSPVRPRRRGRGGPRSSMLRERPRQRRSWQRRPI